MGIHTLVRNSSISLTTCVVLVVFTCCLYHSEILPTIQRKCPQGRDYVTTLVTNMNQKEIERCEKRLPQAILVGAPKCGTSALLLFMSYHPQIAACLKPEEPKYFDVHYENYSLEWYRNLMPCSTPDQITFEKTPTYLYQRKTALRIKQMNDKTKILILLKDPVETAISLYAMNRVLNRTFVFGKSFEDMVITYDNYLLYKSKKINPNADNVQRERYVDYVQVWLEVFGKEQVLVLDGTVLDTDPVTELQKVERFLGINRFYNRDQFVFNERKNKFCFSNNSSTYHCLPPGKGRAHPTVSDELKKMLRAYYQPYNLKLAKMLNRTFVWT